MTPSTGRCAAAWQAFAERLLPLDRLGRLAVVRQDQEASWRRGDCVLAEEYLCLPELALDAELALDIIYSEILLRSARGESISDQEYLRRFPTRAESMNRMLLLFRGAREGLPTPDTIDSSISESSLGGAIDPAKLSADCSIPPVEFSFLDPPLEPGELGRLGRYRVLGQIGKGGMGLVLRAYDPDLDRLVALKVLRPDRSGIPELRERFLREARAAAAVRHDHVVAIHEVSVHNNTPYLAMPLLNGESLEDRLGRTPPLSYEDVLRIGKETSEGLAAAHSRGLVHRDIKPDNLWLDEHEGRVRILDFGLARGGSREGTPTHPGTVLGTPHYMAPEQARGEVVDARADLFSLGSVLYRMSTGQFAFPGDNLYTILNNLATHEPMAPRELNNMLSQEFSDLVMCLLEKNPAERPSSAEAVRVALKSLEVGHGCKHQNKGEKHRRRWAVVLGALFGAILAVLLTVIVIRITRPDGTKMEIVIPVEPNHKDTNKPKPAARTDVQNDRRPSREPGSELRFPDEPLYELNVGCYTAEFSPDGKFIVTAGTPPGNTKRPGLIKIFAATDGSLLAQDDKGDSYVAVFHPNSGRLFQGGRERVVTHDPGFLNVWDWKESRLRFVRSLDWRGEPVNVLAVSGDGKWFAAAGEFKGMTIWTTATLESIPVAYTRCVRALAFSPDSATLAGSGEDGLTYLWTVASIKSGPKAQCKGHTEPVLAVLWSRDGESLYTAGRDGTIRVWDPAGVQRRIVARVNQSISALALSPNGRYLLSGDEQGDPRMNTSLDSSVRAWDLQSGNAVASIAVHRGGVRSLQFSSDGTLFLTSGPEERCARVWKTPDWLLSR